MNHEEDNQETIWSGLSEAITKRDDEVIRQMMLEVIRPMMLPEPEPIIFMKRTIPQGKYDINYVITLLRIILDKCNEMRMQPRDFQFTLQQSLLSLIGMLEVERDQQ